LWHANPKAYQARFLIQLNHYLTHKKHYFMEDMINLNDLLKHEILDLYSVEEQIIEALPDMIEKAKNAELKKALREHLSVTKEQKNRLDQVKELMGDDSKQEERKGFFSRVFGGSEGGGEKCKGMEGIIKEGEKLMEADMSEEVLDAAIIAAAQKVEHYEICGYGTARTYARELELNDVANLLERSLNEEYEADDLLTKLAVTRINLKAEQANGMGESISQRSVSSKTSSSSSNGTSSSAGKKPASQQTGKSPAKKATPQKSKASSNGKGKLSKINSSGKSSSGKSGGASTSSRARSNGQPGGNKKSGKGSPGSSKKTARRKSSASRSR
jgi:ferritin-like metal-binding protein YciE